MSQQIVGFALLLASLGAFPQSAEQSARPARQPKAPSITSVEQLLPAARMIVRRKEYGMMSGWDVQPGKKILMVIDKTNHPLVVEAFTVALEEVGAKVTLIRLEGYPGISDGLTLTDTQFASNWWPQWAWDAIADHDMLVAGALMYFTHVPPPQGFKKSGNESGNLIVTPSGRVVRYDYLKWTPDLLVSSFETFPVELAKMIDEKTWAMLYGANEFRITDLEGTDLTIRISDEEWKKFIADGGSGLLYKPGHLGMPFRGAKDVNGVIGVSSIAGGPVVPAKLTVKDGSVVSVEGGGKFGEVLKQNLLEYPEAGKLATYTIGTNPKAYRPETWSDMGGSARIFAWRFGRQRSGAIHQGLGSAFPTKQWKMIRHMEFYFTTIVADGETVIDRGRLTALDDPEVRRLAAKFGDPDTLLKEEWFPEVEGVNVKVK